MHTESISNELQRGRVCLAQRQWAEARTIFERATKQPQAGAEAFGGLGAAYFALGQYVNAVQAYGRALDLAPTEFTYWRGRGKSHYENNDNEAAIEDLNRALELHVDDPEALCFRGAAYHDMDEDEIGYEDIAKALELNPLLPSGYFFRGRILAKFGDEDGAYADYCRAIEIDPTYPYPYSFRSGLLSAWGETERGVADQQQYLTLMPTASAFHSQAHNWERCDEDEKALACFAEAIRIEPDIARHYSCRASLWKFLGEEAKADADYETIDHINEQEEREDNEMNATIEQRMRVFNQIQEHFGAIPLEEVNVTSREFPGRVAADLQLALDRLESNGFTVSQFWPLHQCGQPPTAFTQLYTRDRRNPPLPVPPEYIEIDVGEEEPVRCLKFGVWLVSINDAQFLVMLDTQNYRGIHFQVAVGKGEAGQAASSQFFTHLEDGIKKGSCYRGKVLSLECQDSYSGQQFGILVHKIRPVQRDEVILPPSTLTLLERNVLQFVRQRPRLSALGLQTKKGLLFYGPPGTGKTHTIHYLSRGIEGQTTFIVTAEQVSMLSEYMTLARLFQPSMVVIEDVDLIARDRTTMSTPGEEALLNKLLNEMDGLKPETDILFVLTTNRPEKLEAALSSRPGRIDQAIEFPLPDSIGREKLVRLYSRKVDVPDDVVAMVVKKTDRVSASFIKELMRRATQFYLDRDGEGALSMEDVSNALEEMLFSGGSLNRVLLGAAEPSVD